MTSLPPFQKLIDAHADEVLGFLRGAVGRAEAEDCFQETFLAALRAYPSLRDASNLRGWLFAIARSKAVDHHRAGARRPLPVADPDPGLPPEDGPEAGEEVWEAVGRLPPKQRAAVALRYALDLPHAEIAAALGCSPEAARRSLFEGMRRLRKEFA